MLDGITFEMHAIPSAVICTEEFEVTGRAMAESWGLPDYNFLLIKHPLSSLTEAELDERARKIAPKVAKLLLGQL